MASTTAQEEFLAVTRKSQEVMIAVIKTWVETVRTATPKLASVYAPLTDKLPALPSLSLPFADKLPGPEDAVASAYHLAEQLLASQRRFTEDLLKATTPLMPGRSYSAPKVATQSKPQAPAQRPQAPAQSTQQETAVDSEPKAAASAVATSTPASPAPKTATAKSAAAKSATAKSATAKSATAKSATAKSAAAKVTPARSRAARPAPKSAPKGPAAN